MGSAGPEESAAVSGDQPDLRAAFRRLSSFDLVGDASKNLEKDAHLLWQGLLEEERELGNAAKPVNCWDNSILGKLSCRANQRPEHIGKLIAHGFFSSHSHRWRLASACLPIIKCQRTLKSLSSYGKRRIDVGFPEQYSYSKFSSYMRGDTHRKGNVTTLIKAFEKHVKMSMPTRGTSTA